MKIFGLFGPMELIIILAVVLIIFGPKNLPKLGSAIGKGVKNLREGIGSKNNDEASEEFVEMQEEPEPIKTEAAPAPKKKVVKKVVKKVDTTKTTTAKPE